MGAKLVENWRVSNEAIAFRRRSGGCGSFINEISGDTTIVSPLRSSAGN
jgi:hypothetical protein